MKENQTSNTDVSSKKTIMNKGTREILILSNQGKAAVPELAMIHKGG